MARIRSIAGEIITPLSTGWEMAATAPGVSSTPAGLPEVLEWLPALVPGTVAATLAAAGRWNAADPEPLHGKDFWYRIRYAGRAPETLRFGGLATLATVWLNGREILYSTNMFHEHEVDVELDGENELVICFRALDAFLSEPLPAGRWRPRMISPSTLRHVRTTVLGHMPGWCPNIHAIGPWRPVDRVTHGPIRITNADVRSRLEGATGLLDVALRLDADAPVNGRIVCGGKSAELVERGDGTYSATLEIPDVKPWWPHTHGAPSLYDVEAMLGDARVDLGRTGFRTIEVDRDSDGRGFGLRVNGQSVFCRGAVWSCADLETMPQDRASFEPWLRAARDANMNMIRVPGTTVYEADAFFDLADELGILVWQDFMFANFDYPAADPAFARSVEREAEQFLSRVQIAPSLAVLCGGSEVYQQAAMLGFPPRKYLNPIFEGLLPGILAGTRPDVPYVTGSPSGGPLPFVVNEGVGHYWGVGGYKRPLSDARGAGVRFASECLAFANVPEETTLAAGAPAPSGVGDPRWKAGVPRDVGASWDFEDVRDHYLALLLGVDAAALRYADAERYLEVSRIAQAEVMERVATELMRQQSPARGALVLMLQDLAPGAGWGVIAADGTPKSPWYALRRAFAPVRANMTDEGVNGLAIHVANDTGGNIDARLSLAALRDGRTQVLQAKRDIHLAPHSAHTISAFDLIGSFFDINYAYRFNAPQHDSVVVNLEERATGRLLAQSVYFPCGHEGNTGEAELSAELRSENGAWSLTLNARRLARYVHLVDPHYRADDSWFHLPPNSPRTLRLFASGPTSAAPRGIIRALNLRNPLAYGLAT